MVDFEMYRFGNGNLDMLRMMSEQHPDNMSETQVKRAIEFLRGIEEIWPIRSRQVAAIAFATAVMISDL